MEKLLCSGCGAAIVPNNTQPFLTCEYCDTSMSNPYYDQSAATQAAEAAKPSPAENAVAALLEMGQAQNLADLDRSCFGNPINGIDNARVGLSIPDAQRVYFLYAHNILLLGFSEGLALTDDGLYYSCDSGKGSLSWEAFITGAIACVDYADGQDGTLKIGSSVEIGVKSEKDSRLARFLVDFHNHMYHQYTGETAPASWAVTEPTLSAAQEKDSSLLGTVLPVVGALLGTNVARKQTVVQRVPTMHSTSRPTVRQDRRDQVEPPRPLHSQPHHRPAQKSPGMAARPGMGSQRGPAMGTQRGPGNQRRPGGMGGQRGPGGMGGPGRGRR